MKYGSRSIDSKYNLYLSTDKRLNYGNLNLNDNSEQILALKNNVTCEELSLSNNKDLSNAKLQEILNTMTNIKYLCLYNLSNLTSIEFVKNMPNLIELDLYNTSVTDLSSLEGNCDNLYSLRLNNNSIDLSTIQTVISNMWSNMGNLNASKSFLPVNSVGLVLTTKELWKKLESCREITSLISWGQGSILNNLGWECDLSNTKITKINIYQLSINFKFPSSLTSMSIGFPENGFYCDGSLCTKITDINLSDFATKSSDAFSNSIHSFSTFPNLNSLSLNNMMGDYNLNAFSNCSFSKLNTLKITGSSSRKFLTDITGIGNVTTLKTLEITYPNESLMDFSEIGNLTQLNDLRIRYSSFYDISFVKKLTNIQKLELANNKINSCISLKNLNSLQKLDLTNNNIEQYSAEGSQRYNNMQILADLNKNSNKGGNLEELYLSGNTGITDFTPVSSLTWTKHDGF